MSWRTRPQKFPPLEPLYEAGREVVAVPELDVVVDDVDEAAVFEDDPHAAAASATSATVNISFRAGNFRVRMLSP
ncbi:MAG: hypothetical protein ACLPVY_18975 [Acidimicrobiia bacterium]